MGFGKSFKKAFKKVRKVATKPLGAAIRAVGGAEPRAPEVAQQEVIPPAAVDVATPTTTQAEDESSTETESERRKARAGGKKSLSVSRASGGGINL